MPQKDASRCWLCGRTSTEVRESVGKPLQPESEVDRRFAKVRELKAMFTRESGEWWSRVPDQLKGMDFNFVIGNVSQFKGVGFIEEAAKIKKNVAEPMSEAAQQVRDGAAVSLGEVRVSANDSKRDSVVRAIEEFEKKSGRALSNGRGEGSSGPHGFDGMDFGRGIGFLRDVGMLFFNVQEMLLESEREEEMSRRPTFGVGVAHVPSVSGDLHVCSICQNLITALPSA
jgi:hypothetical protein